LLENNLYNTCIKKAKRKKILQNTIKECIKNPLKIISENNIKRVIKKLNDKLLITVHKIENETFIVITAYTT
jgi:formiminotetrahydrofolate cyclodeaminase